MEIDPYKHYRVTCPKCGIVIRQCRCYCPREEIQELCKSCSEKNKSFDNILRMATLFSKATKLDIFSIELPKSNSVEYRVEWAGNKIADAAEGILDSEEGWFIWSTIVGWADLANENDRRQYLALANSLADILRNNEEK